MHTLKHVIVLFFAFAWATLVSAQQVTPLDPPQPVENDGKIEVLEFFAYGCIHCYNLEPKFEEWAKRQPADVKIKRIPSPAMIAGVNSVPIYYTLEAMGIIDKLHVKLFDAVHRDRVMLGNPSTLNEWLAKNGVDPKKFEEMKKSFSVANKINRATQQMIDYRIEVTPTLVINGRHRALQGAGGTEALFAAVDNLIKTARSATAAPIASAPPVVALTATPAKTPAAASAKTQPAKAPANAAPKPAQ